MSSQLVALSSIKWLEAVKGISFKQLWIEELVRNAHAVVNKVTGGRELGLHSNTSLGTGRRDDFFEPRGCQESGTFVRVSHSQENTLYSKCQETIVDLISVLTDETESEDEASLIRENARACAC